MGKSLIGKPIRCLMELSMSPGLLPTAKRFSPTWKFTGPARYGELHDTRNRTSGGVRWNAMLGDDSRIDGTFTQFPLVASRPGQLGSCPGHPASIRHAGTGRVRPVAPRNGYLTVPPARVRLDDLLERRHCVIGRQRCQQLRVPCL